MKKSFIILFLVSLAFAACEKPEKISESDPEAYAASLKPVTITAIAPYVTINGVSSRNKAELTIDRGEEVSITAHSRSPISLEVRHNGDFYYYFSSSCDTVYTYTYFLE